MKKTVGILLGLMLVALCFLGVWTQQKNIDNDEPADITKLSVSVSCGEYYGCGTVYAKEGKDYVIVSARHILEDYYAGISTNIEVTFSDGASTTAEIIKEDNALDIVFLSVKRDIKRPSVNKEARDPLTAGETVYLVDANTSDIYAGSIASPSVYSEDFAMDMIYCYCAVTPGMSGTGLFDEDGRYLGILLGGSDEADAVCLDASTVEAVYSGH